VQVIVHVAVLFAGRLDQRLQRGPQFVFLAGFGARRRSR
jgi:hypothetical protein